MVLCMVFVVVVLLVLVLARLWLRLTPSTFEALMKSCVEESGLLWRRWRWWIAVVVCVVVVVVVHLELVLSRLWLRLTPSTLEALIMACVEESGLLCRRWR